MSERHEKWTPVSPGTVIPAGQPYRVEFLRVGSEHLATERVGQGTPVYLASDAHLFVDSSWRPPLELPTEPTWALVVKPNGYVDTLEVWHDPRQGDGVCYRNAGLKGWMSTTEAVAIVPLTDEQVARIEAAL